MFGPSDKSPLESAQEEFIVLEVPKYSIVLNY